MIFLKAPSDFNPKIDVAACFILVGKEFLCLETAKQKKLGGLWGVPAGKLNKNENEIDGVLREVEEETKIIIKKEQLKKYKTIYVRYPEMDFVYRMFYTTLKQKPTVILATRESSAYKWTTKEEALKLPPIPDEHECVKMFFEEIIEKKEHF